MLSPAARILAAANTCCALTERRTHRPARSPERAAEELTRAAATFFAMENNLLA